MLTIEVNGKSIEARQGETILTALRRAGVRVPTLCHMPNLSPTGACRICVVEVDGMRSLVPSCAYPVQARMKIRTHSPRAIRARHTIVELLLAGHPDDCLYCVRNGNCDLQGLACELGVRARRFPGTKKRAKIDMSSPSIARDPAKCILCGKCVRVCEEVQGVAAIDFLGRGSRTVVGTTFDTGINLSSCISCGQCIAVCPTGALSEKSAIEEVLGALADPQKYVVVQHAPAVSVSLGEEFGLRPGNDVAGAMVGALRAVGFKRVFDTAFAADLTVMEEATELVQRIRSGGPLPMMTSCSPGWVKFVEHFYPDFIPNLSTCKSPHQMLGALIKSYFAEKAQIDPTRIYSVSIMPCTAKKFEASRPELGRDGMADVDAVLTTRELAQLIRMHGLDLSSIPPQMPDTPFGERSSAGKLFGGTGGVAEAALRSAHYFLTGEEMNLPRLSAVRGSAGLKEAHIVIGGREIVVAVASGLANARRILDSVRAGRKDLHFVEVMTCPGGCVSGGGQPYGGNSASVRARMQALYTIDRDAILTTAHRNESIRRIYREYLGEPLGHRSHELLHTRYAPREVVC